MAEKYTKGEVITAVATHFIALQFAVHDLASTAARVSQTGRPVQTLDAPSKLWASLCSVGAGCLGITDAAGVAGLVNATTETVVLGGVAAAFDEAERLVAQAAGPAEHECVEVLLGTLRDGFTATGDTERALLREATQRGHWAIPAEELN